MNGKKTIALWLLPAVMTAAVSTVVAAVEPGRWYLGLHNGLVCPVGSLSRWFSPTLRAYGIGIARWQNQGWSWEFSVEALSYDRENSSRLFYRDLDLQLDSYSGTVRAGHAFWSRRDVCASAVLGAGIHRWHSHRGSYQLPEVFVPARNQDDWSWAFEAGMAVRLPLLWRFHLQFCTMYRLVVGELWPALALRLESVSGMQNVLFGVSLWAAM